MEPIAFVYDFGLEGKAVDNPDSYILEDGDLIIQGWAAEFEGIDRQGENFVDGAFQRGIKSFLENGAPLCYHHKTSKCLGKVLELEEVPGRGLKMIARVDGAIKDHPEMGTYYQQIKKGSLNSLSVGGFFGRTMTPAGPRINNMDFTECSITPVAVHPKTSFEVVAGKALEAAEDEPEDEAFNGMLSSLDSALDSLEAAFNKVSEGKAAPEPKGDLDDRYTLALILALEQATNSIDDDEDNPGDARVDALAEKVKVCLDEVSREAHALAAKLGPLPKVTSPEHY